MISIVRIGSRQYNVTLGSKIRVEKLDVKKGDFWTSKDVLSFQDDKGKFTIGEPFVNGAQIKAQVIRHGKTKKIIILKKKRRKGYRRTQGHRQLFTELFISALSDSSGKWTEVKKKTKVVQKSIKMASQTKSTSSMAEKKQAVGRTKLVKTSEKLKTKDSVQKSKRG